jgi:hypothetical protein
MSPRRGDEALSVADMLRDQRAQGVTISELARMLGRSERMVRKVINGETSGEAYRAAATELYERGRVSAAPPRRRGKAGKVVPVRASRSAGGGVRVPAEPRPKRGRFSESLTPLAGGARQYEFGAPKTRDSKGRAQANATIVSRLRSAAKGQRWDRKKVKFDIRLSNGHAMTVGSKHGYQVSSVLGRSRGFEGDALGWLKTQVQHRYPDLDKAGVVITGITMTVYSHRDEKAF